MVYSREEPVKTGEIERLEEIREAEAPKRRSIPASNAFVPPSAGLLIASEVVRDLTGSW